MHYILRQKDSDPRINYCFFFFKYYVVNEELKELLCVETWILLVLKKYQMMIRDYLIVAKNIPFKCSLQI